MEYVYSVTVVWCILLLWPVAESAELQACGGNAADIMFVLDASGSIVMNDFKKQLQFTKDIVKIFDIGPERTRVGILCFSTNVEEELGLGESNDKQTIFDRISSIPYQGGGTNTGEALHYLLSNVFVPGVMRDNVAHIAIVLTDGMSFSKDYNTLEMADRLHKSGVTVFAIGIGDQVQQAELNGIASRPSERYKFMVDSYDALNSIKEKLAIKTCEEPPATTPPVIPTVGGRLCRPRESLEISIGFDLSGIGTENSKFVMHFISNVTRLLSNRMEDMTVSAVTGGCGAANQEGDSLFTNAHTPQDVNRHLGTISTPSFDYIMRKMRLKFSNKKIRKVGLLFMDKMLRKREFSKSKRESQYAKFMGAEIFTIGIGHRISAQQGGKLATNGNDYFHADSYETLHNIEEQVSCVL